MEQKNTKKCPYCGEEILDLAKKCKHCGEWLDNESTEQTSAQPEVSKQSQQRKSKTFLNKKRFLMVIPMSVIAVFAIILLVFHLNYSYTDWWVDEKDIILSAIGIFCLLICIYYIIILRKFKIIIPIKAFFKSKTTKIAFGILCVGAVVAYSMSLHRNNVSKQKEQAAAAIKAHNDSIANYEETASNMKASARAIKKLPFLIFYDLDKNWSSAIFKDKAYNTNNKRVRCDDFNIAIDWRMKFYEKEGAFGYLDKYMNAMKKEMNIINNPPVEKYKVLSEKLNDLYLSLARCVSYCKSPEGNLKYFREHTTDLTQDIDDKIAELDLILKKDNEDSLVDILYSNAVSDQMNSYINDVLAK